VPLADVAVLFRAGFHSFDLEIELAREGIDFIKVGGFKFMESAHIKDMLAYLKIVETPGDRLSWQRILQLLPGIGPKGAHNICTAVLAEDNGFRGLLTARFAKSQSEPIMQLKALYGGIDAQTMSVAQLGESVMKYYGSVLEATYDDHPRRRKDLEQLLVIMQRYDRLEPFLTDMALEPPNASNRSQGLTSESEAERAGGAQRMTLSTIHSAKGLEWHTVFILWALDGRFPSLQALDTPENYEEELRLMYVAATRAREKLFFVYPKNVYDRGSGGLLSQPSRFLADFSKQLLSRVTIRRRGARYGGWH
jgi:DNA helicase-2/ATP-dependent DNA helicase PcrA